MQILYLIRHGETAHNRDGRVQGHTESDLSDMGREQAARIADRLSKVPFVAAYSSPLRRAWDTCQIAIGDRMDVTAHMGLREINLGSWEGKKASALRKQYPVDVKEWFRRPTRVNIEGAETIRVFRNRVVTTMNEILNAHDEGAVAVFAHGGVICTYLTSVLNMRLDDIWRFKIRNGSVTRVLFPMESPRVDLLGDVHHLDGLLRPPPAKSFRLFP